MGVQEWEFIFRLFWKERKKKQKKTKKKQKTNPDFEDCKKVNKKSFVSAIVPHTH